MATASRSSPATATPRANSPPASMSAWSASTCRFRCRLAITASAAGSAPVDDKAKNTAGLPTINDSVPDASGAPPAKAPAASTEQPAATVSIPAALQGRWGLAPNDCTSTRGDAKGLLVIGPDQLTFYESRAVPAAGAPGAS